MEETNDFVSKSDFLSVYSQRQHVSGFEQNCSSCGRVKSFSSILWAKRDMPVYFLSWITISVQLPQSLNYTSMYMNWPRRNKERLREFRDFLPLRNWKTTLKISRAQLYLSFFVVQRTCLEARTTTETAAHFSSAFIVAMLPFQQYFRYI